MISIEYFHDCYPSVFLKKAYYCKANIEYGNTASEAYQGHCRGREYH